MDRVRKLSLIMKEKSNQLLLLLFSLIVKEWSHQLLSQRKAFRSSAVLPIITEMSTMIISSPTTHSSPLGGDTRVLTIRNRTNIPTMAPSLLIRSMSVILTAFADRTRNMTEILERSLVCKFGGTNLSYLQVFNMRAP